jgi:hypothetical protein
MRFFSSLPAAAEWLCGSVARAAGGPLTSKQLVAAAETVRRLAPERPEDGRRARAHPVVLS